MSTHGKKVGAEPLRTIKPHDSTFVKSNRSQTPTMPTTAASTVRVEVVVAIVETKRSRQMSKDSEPRWRASKEVPREDSARWEACQQPSVAARRRGNNCSTLLAPWLAGHPP